ncbi:(2Fe-2S)-binding protein [Aquabacterium sp. OR-4]|uniref:(2Fe-2S)-binding protein n=1 Tax=Aquabacterium sp. OR-4 TaxID=2978127 RepID=UPI0021B28F32|nr:(2Fe-2S)-binding protein [Aquabacterium sp. OR-4]MDT7836952.1 (2Fe-2S)-binding protein [Aquabacterium sp. OR-4]
MATLNLNGQRVTVDAPPEMPLLWVLRDRLDLRGSKYGCGVAQCRACTVHLNGTATPSCVLPIGALDGKAQVVSIEGLKGRVADTVRAAWVELGVAQCGYCQAGQVMGAVALLSRNPKPDDAAIDDAMSAHLCRCGTYPRIRAAIHLAASRL